MLGWLYGKIANLRNALYEKGVFSSRSLGVKTISVGNLTVGGTGKTPLVRMIAEILAERGEKVCVLSRGYGRENPKSRVLVSDGEKVLAEAKYAGDEPFELAQNLPGKAIVIADANRVAAARWAREKFDVTAFVLDDAFQHQKVKRDLNVVLLDATNPFGDYKMLPFGRLREPLENLRRADVIVITRSNLIDETEIAKLKAEISKYNSQCPILTAHNKVSKLTNLREFQTANETEILIPQIKTRKSLVFCALGNPQNFFEQLKREDFNLAAARKFPDHHFYKAADVEKLNAEAEKSGAECFLTTAKDAVKLTGADFKISCYVVENDLIFEAQTFVNLVIDLLNKDDFFNKKMKK